jgi:hypothetical protein
LLIQSARYSGRKFRSSSPGPFAIASTNSVTNVSLAGSSQWRSSIRITKPFGLARSISLRTTATRRRCRPWASKGGAGRSGSGTPRKSKTSGSTSRKLSSMSSNRPAIRSRASRGSSRSLIPK